MSTIRVGELIEALSNVEPDTKVYVVGEKKPCSEVRNVVKDLDCLISDEFVMFVPNRK